VCEKGRTGYDAFFALLNDGAYHEFRFPQLGRKWRLRLAAEPGLEVSGDYRVFSLRLADDFPVDEDYDYLAPLSTYNVPDFGVLLDGRNVRSYGVGLTGDYRGEVYRAPEVKKNLTQSVDDLHGLEYDGGTVVYREKEVRLSMLMASDSPDSFWRNYDALLYDLIRPGVRRLKVGADVFECYYKECSPLVFCLAEGGVVFYAFDLSLIFTGYRP
jgi:hypothetical protein